jgi:hypothetical protein
VAVRESQANSNCPSPVSPYTPPGALGVTDTELVQHYLSHTIDTFGISGAPSQEIWRSVIPAIAFTSQVVRHGLLTLGAMCLSHDVKYDPDQSLKYYQTAEYYGEQFVEAASKQLREVKPADVDTNLACTRLLTVLAFAFFRAHQHQVGVRITESPAWKWLHMMRGTSTVHIHYYNSDETPNEVMARDLGPEQPYSGNASIDAGWERTRLRFELHPQFSYIKTTRQARYSALFEALETRRSILQPGQADEILAAINLLVSVTDMMCCGEQVYGVMRIIGRWPANISRGFVEMLTAGYLPDGSLSAGSLFALAVHAHWLMLVVLTEQVWFMDDMGRYGITEISALCDAEPLADVERSLMEWPKKMLPKPGDNNELFGSGSGIDFDALW